MKINTKIKPTSLFLDLKPNAVLVADGNAAGEPETKHPALNNRPDVFRFITRKNTQNMPSSFYFLVEYENMFYGELRRLLNLIDANPDLDIYVDALGRFKDDKWDIFHKIIQPKLLIALKDKDVTLLWDPETVDQVLTPFWGFLDVEGNYNIFHKEDPAVPFEHDHAKEYFEINAMDKEHAISLIKGDYGATH